MAKSKTSDSGVPLLENPILNKGTAFTEAERQEYRLEGLLPAAIDSLDNQVLRVLNHLAAKPTNLEQYVYLQELCNRNQTLFYATLATDPAKFIPIVYDPTIADACLAYGQVFRRPQGMYLNKTMTGRFKEVLSHWPEKHIDFICISSGGRILGLGDIGANGAPIPVGKLQLYTACAAVPPRKLLPIHLDIGTTNDKLRADPLYVGLRSLPPENDELDALMDEFMAAANEVFPGVCVHFEDWKGTDAIRLLDRYREQYLVYNDDIQGTASVTLSGIMTALKIKEERLADQRFLFAGAGSAGTGIANMLVLAMQEEGLSEEEARSRIAMFDIDGLLTQSRDDLNPSQKPYAVKADDARDLIDAVNIVQPTALIGVSTAGGLFTEEVVKAVAGYTRRPIVFPLSNPTNKAECTAMQAYQWTDGKALVAAGVQFPEVTIDGHTYHPGQANNFYVFPAMALAVHATRPRNVDDAMWIAAARGCADQVDPNQLAKGKLYPSQDQILEVEITTATRIAMDIFQRGLATVEQPGDIRNWIVSHTYQPTYQAAN